jgi:2,4-dienoyl-CoA reductase-like NADH-dependent reductase (Old Yellow Enzyme family)
MSCFTELPRGSVRLGAAGKVTSAAAAAWVLEAGCDFVLIGRAAILRHDFPERVRRDPAYQSPALPVTAQHLREEGVSARFINYIATLWPDFVATEETAA